MARGNVFIADENGDARAWRTDLKGRGPVREGEEFTIRQLWQFGHAKLMPGGIKRRVRVVAVDRVRGFDVLKCETIEDLTPEPQSQGSLLD
jgi:hypothetical protein